MRSRLRLDPSGDPNRLHEATRGTVRKQGRHRLYWSIKPTLALKQGHFQLPCPTVSFRRQLSPLRARGAPKLDPNGVPFKRGRKERAPVLPIRLAQLPPLE